MLCCDSLMSMARRHSKTSSEDLHLEVECFMGSMEATMGDHLLKPLISTYDDWRIPYVGRTINEKFWTKFDKRTRKIGNKVRAYGCHILESTFEQENDYDDESTCHSLCVDFVSGSNPLIIESIVGSRQRHWHTNSNWQDHAEWRDTEWFNPNDIPIYKSILDETTAPAFFEIGHDYVLKLFGEAKSHCARFKDKAIGKYKEASWWFAGVDSALLVEILSYAKTFPELFFAFDFARSLPFLNPEIKKIDANSIRPILQLVDKKKFYGGYGEDLSYEKKVRSAIDRLVDQCGVFGDMFSMPQKMIRSMIEIQAEIRLKAMPDDYLYIKKDYRDVNVSEYEANAIPDGTFFYFAWDSRPLGIVTPDGTAREWGNALDINQDMEKTPPNWSVKNRIVGVMNDKCEVLDSNGDIICMIRHKYGVVSSWDAALRDPPFKVSVDNEGHILYGNIYRGYVLRAEVTPAKGSFHKQLTLMPFSWSDLGKHDKRLAGLALFSYVPREELKELYQGDIERAKRMAEEQKMRLKRGRLRRRNADEDWNSNENRNESLNDLMMDGLIDIYGEPGGWQFNNED